MEMLQYRILVVCLCCSVTVFGQNPIIFNCVNPGIGSNPDTLFWTNTGNAACGTVPTTIVWSSNTLDGPYSQVLTIPGKTDNMAIVPKTGDSFYYITYEYPSACNPFPPSDTLSNLDVPKVVFQAVSVNDNNDVELLWSPDQTKTIDSFIIIRSFGSTGSFPIDTVSSTSYIDNTASPDAGPQLYFIQGINYCRPESGTKGDDHTTMWLESSGNTDFCDQSFPLSWTSYGGWSGVERQEIWLAYGTDPLTKWADVPAGQNEFVLSGVEPGRTFRVAVKAYEQGGSAESFSNRVSAALNVLDPMDSLIIRNVTVTGENIRISYSLDYIADVTDFYLLRTEVSSGRQDTFDIDVLSLFENNDFVDTTNVDVSKQYEYQFFSIDQCNNILSSQVFPNLVLEGISGGSNVVLTWDPLDVDSIFVSGYLIFDSTGALIGSVPDSVNTVSIVDSNNTGSQQCYRIAARIVREGARDTLSALSNSICVVSDFSFYIPNAFYPNGFINPIFKPEFSDPNGIEVCDLSIYDRWGNLLFKSDCRSGQGWDGTVDGQPLDVGMYLYVINAAVFGGNLVQRAGELVLLR